MSEQELLTFFRALADANRLKIIGLLARQPHSVEQLAAILGVRPSTVSHHLAKLSKAGLVSARSESYYNIYSLEEKALENMTHRLLSDAALPSAADGIDIRAYDRKVVADFSQPDGRLRTIPAQRKKLEAVLRHIQNAFEPGLRYSEKQVNEILQRYHSDTATLRRELVGYKFLERDAGGVAYWRPEETPAESSSAP